MTEDNEIKYELKDRSPKEQEEIILKVKDWFKNTYDPPFKFDALINDDFSISIINLDNK